jgi:hypothetical protein
VTASGSQRRHHTLSIAIILLLLASRCGTPTEPAATPLKTGGWNAPGVAVTVTSTSLTFLTGSCWFGEMPRPFLDAAGRFEVVGTMDQQFGPPRPAPAATFADHVAGDEISFVVRLANGTTVGPIAAKFGAPRPLIAPCPP